MDFYGATACMTLCLAHLDGHRSGSSSFLAHQRLGDRGMMEDVLVRMSQIAKTNGDALSTQSADVPDASASRRGGRGARRPAAI